MSRSVRRVPLDFDWPLNTTWTGYLMPDELRLPPCPDCRWDRREPTGYSREAHAIANTFYPHQIVHAGAFHGAREHADSLAWHDKLGQAEVDFLVKKGRLRECVARTPTEDNPRHWEWVTVPRTAAEVNAANAQTGMHDLSHDGINRMYLIEFRCKRLGISMHCPTCDGTGHVGTEEQKAAHEAWTPTEHPTGPGWQLWETIGDGAPISPVFGDRTGLINWLCSPAYRWGVSRPMDRAQAERFVEAEGVSFSGYADATGVHHDAADIFKDA